MVLALGQLAKISFTNLQVHTAVLLLPGICGQPRLTDIGGVPYLVPIVQTDKVRVDLSLSRTLLRRIGPCERERGSFRSTTSRR